jgi:hypothetical protein
LPPDVEELLDDEPPDDEEEEGLDDEPDEELDEEPDDDDPLDLPLPELLEEPEEPLDPPELPPCLAISVQSVGRVSLSTVAAWAAVAMPRAAKAVNAGRKVECQVIMECSLKNVKKAHFICIHHARHPCGDAVCVSG